MMSRDRYSRQGQIKLGVKLMNNSLILYIEEASGLKSEWRTKCTAYAQTQICPDDQSQSRDQTKAVSESNNPVFNYTVKYELQSLDNLQKKRVMISVWHQDPIKNCAEFIGCLSFGLSHLVSKCRKQEVTGVSGWYYLLSAEIGHRKHILARSAEVTKVSSENVEMSQEEEKENQRYKSLTFVMKHRSPGYGFTVRGPNPIRVGRIKVGGPAHEAGMRKGDIILRINGHPMADTDMQLVAEVIRKSDVQVTIDVSRKLVAKSTSPSKSVVANNKVTPRSLKCKLGDSVGHLKRKCDFSDEEFEQAGKKMQPVGVTVTSEDGRNNQNMYTEGLFCKPCGKMMLPHWAEEEDSVANQKLCKKQQNYCDHVKFITNQLTTISPTKYRKWNPEISCITTASSRVQDLVDSVVSEADDCLTLNPLNTRLDSFSSGATSSSSLCGNVVHASPLYTTALHRADSTASLMDKYPLLSPTTHQQYNSSKDNGLFSSQLHCPSRSSSSASSITESRVADMTDFDSMTSLVRDATVECSVNSENELRRDLSIRTLIKCEEEYVRCMQKGVQTYSRPLRFGVLSTEQNEVLFQNIEKLTTISQYNLSKLVDSQLLTEQSVNGSMRPGQCQAENIGEIYQTTITMLCQGYIEYIDGLQAATQLLTKLRQNPDIEKTLQKQKSRCDRDILDFLQQPLLHFEFLHRAFKDIYGHTSTDHQDFTALQRVVDKFAEAFSILC